MSTINLEFTGGELTSVDATGPWYASYFLNGHYELSTAESAGHYLVTVEDASPWQHWRTTVDTSAFQQLHSTHEFLVFTDPPVGGVTGVPEASTWLMLLMGFACIGFSIFRQRLTTVSRT